MLQKFKGSISTAKSVDEILTLEESLSTPQSMSTLFHRIAALEYGENSARIICFMQVAIFWGIWIRKNMNL